MYWLKISNFIVYCANRLESLGTQDVHELPVQRTGEITGIEIIGSSTYMPQ